MLPELSSQVRLQGLDQHLGCILMIDHEPENLAKSYLDSTHRNSEIMSAVVTDQVLV
jgi:hypothetical protein